MNNNNDPQSEFNHAEFNYESLTQWEVRLTAMILGEASDFERDQLLQLIEEDSEIADLHYQLVQVHRCLLEVGRGDFPVADHSAMEANTDEGAASAGESSGSTEWKLSRENRERLLSVLEGKPVNQSLLTRVDDRVITPKKSAYRWWVEKRNVVLSGVAAAAVLLIAWVAIPRSMYRLVDSRMAEPTESQSKSAYYSNDDFAAEMILEEGEESGYGYGAKADESDLESPAFDATPNVVIGRTPESMKRAEAKSAAPQEELERLSNSLSAMTESQQMVASAANDFVPGSPGQESPTSRPSSTFESLMRDAATTGKPGSGGNASGVSDPSSWNIQRTSPALAKQEASPPSATTAQSALDFPQMPTDSLSVADGTANRYRDQNSNADQDFDDDGLAFSSRFDARVGGVIVHPSGVLHAESSSLGANNTYGVPGQSNGAFGLSDESNRQVQAGLPGAGSGAGGYGGGGGGLGGGGGAVPSMAADAPARGGRAAVAQSRSAGESGSGRGRFDSTSLDGQANGGRPSAQVLQIDELGVAVNGGDAADWQRLSRTRSTFQSGEIRGEKLMGDTYALDSVEESNSPFGDRQPTEYPEDASRGLAFKKRDSSTVSVPDGGTVITGGIKLQSPKSQSASLGKAAELATPSLPAINAPSNEFYFQDRTVERELVEGLALNRQSRDGKAKGTGTKYVQGVSQTLNFSIENGQQDGQSFANGNVAGSTLRRGESLDQLSSSEDSIGLNQGTIQDQFALDSEEIQPQRDYSNESLFEDRFAENGRASNRNLELQSQWYDAGREARSSAKDSLNRISQLSQGVTEFKNTKEFFGRNQLQQSLGRKSNAEKQLGQQRGQSFGTHLGLTGELDRRSDESKELEEVRKNKSELALSDKVVGEKSRSIAATKPTPEPALQPAPQPAPGLEETSAASEAFSTFSLHVSDVSFKLANSALAQGQWPEAGKIRIEEFVNALDYRDPLPGAEEKVACQVEQAIHPFQQQRNLLRVSMRTAATGRPSSVPLRLTLLLDNSGSMDRPDRSQTVVRAVKSLAQQLGPNDQVTLISFANKPRLVADQLNGANAGQLVEQIVNLPSEGGTNFESALQLATEKAVEQRLDNAQNRVVLFTDGAVNLGDSNPEQLSKLVDNMRDNQISFDAAGISAQDLNDEVLESLTRRGDGRYYLLDSTESAEERFAQQLAGALRPSAKNVKVQIEFNPKRVGNYKLLGFEKHRLEKEDFRNDSVDAAELAAAEAGVGVYQFEPLPNGSGDVGAISVRFQDLNTGQMVERRWPIPYNPSVPRIEDATPSLKLATASAFLAAKLKGDALGAAVELKSLAGILSGLPENERSIRRVRELENMVQQARQISEQRP